MITFSISLLQTKYELNVFMMYQQTVEIHVHLMFDLSNDLRNIIKIIGVLEPKKLRSSANISTTIDRYV